MRFVRRTWSPSGPRRTLSLFLKGYLTVRTISAVYLSAKIHMCCVYYWFNNQKIAICKTESCCILSPLLALRRWIITLSQRINYESYVFNRYIECIRYRLQPRILSKEQIDQWSVIHEWSWEAPFPWIGFPFLSISLLSRLVYNT